MSESNKESSRPDPTPELLRLLELTAKYPEIGPPLAELAFKIGLSEIGERIVRLGVQGEGPGLEHRFVAANAARRDGRWGDALGETIEAVRAFLAAPETALAPDDAPRLLHLVRLGFATLMFDVKDVASQPEFVRGLAEELPKLEPRFSRDPFFRTLLAQTRWFEDRGKSEEEWELAADLGEPELTWNARGTWYKEAERDLDKAERAYRSGLEKAPHSTLLLHNLAQVIVEKAANPEVDVSVARRLLRDADGLLRAALREEAPKGLRRHIHATKDRVNALRSSLPSRGGAAGGGGAGPGEGAPDDEPPADAEPAWEPQVGEVVRGRVASLAAYGAFVSLGGRHVGLLHKTELAHEHVADPANLVKVGDEIEVKILEVKPGDRGKLRIALSRRALLPAPAAVETAAPPRDRDRDRPRDRDRDRDRGPKVDKSMVEGKLVSLGAMLAAKLKEPGK